MGSGAVKHEVLLAGSNDRAPVGLVWSVWCRAVRCRALVGSACLCARAAQTLVTLVRRTRAVTVARSRSAARGLLCLAGRQELAGGKVVPVGERLRVALLVASPGARTVEREGAGGHASWMVLLPFPGNPAGVVSLVRPRKH